MPSLKELQDFASSFKDLGDEVEVISHLGLPPDEHPLPTVESASQTQVEPQSFDESDSDSREAFTDDVSSPIELDAAVPFDDAAPVDLDEFADGSGGLGTDILSGLDDLLGDTENVPSDPGESIPDDFALPDDAATPAPSDDLGDFADLGDLSIPDDFAAGEASETASDDSALDPNDSPETAETSSADNDFADLNLDDLGDFPPIDSELPASAEAADSFDLGDINLGDIDFGDFAPDPESSSDLDTELGSNFARDPASDLGTDFSADRDLDSDLGGDSFTDPQLETGIENLTTENLDDDDAAFDSGSESVNFDTSSLLEDTSDDPFDTFSMDSDPLPSDLNLDGEDAVNLEQEIAELGEFSSSEADSFFDGKSESPDVAPFPDTGQAAQEDDEKEELSLSSEELAVFQETLASYPLNLRLACGELIAERHLKPENLERLVLLIASGASADEAAALAEKLLERRIVIPKGFVKKTGEELEAEQSSFGYIFIHNFLPVFRLLMLIAVALVCVGYLSLRLIINPLRAEQQYQLGIERIEAGEFAIANERFNRAFRIQPKKSWFFEYARAFQNARQYTLAEEKYLELLNFTASRNRRAIPEKAAVLEYAAMVGGVLGNHERAESILRRNILDFSPWDRDAILALGDNALSWSEYDPARLETARESFAILMERHGRSDPLLERMLLYFIRTDNLEEVLALQDHFMFSERRQISALALAELGGYLLDKRLEDVRGVPNEFLHLVGGIREVLLRSVRQDPFLPEAYYHLARYYNYFEYLNDERHTLEVGLRVFAAAHEESARRIRYHIDALRRYGDVLIKNREFFPAEENLERAVRLYQDAISRRLLSPSPEYGRIYATIGDLEFFTREGNMERALEYYNLAEGSGWSPPEIRYRMGVAFYLTEQWESALTQLSLAQRETPLNPRILYALGNVSFMRGNFFAAQGHYDQLLSMLNADRQRIPAIIANGDDQQMDLAERLMVAQNNLGVTLEALTQRTGNNSFRARAQGLYSESAQAWDILTRDPDTMIRMRPAPGLNAPSVNAGFLNIQNSLNPKSDYEPFFFLRVDKDMFSSSVWENLAPTGFRLSHGIGISSR